MEMTKRILNLEKLPKADDTADALAIAICHAHSGSSLKQSVVVKQKNNYQKNSWEDKIKKMNLKIKD